MKNVKWDLFKIFCIVANCNNYAEASIKLNISRTAISKSIINLEIQLDKELFYRNNKGILLTSEGKNMYERIYPAFQILETEENIEDTEHIKIGTYSHISSFLTEKIINAQNDNPNFKVSLINVMRRNELVDALIRNKVNFIIDTNENEVTDKRIQKYKLAELDNIFILNIPTKINNIKEFESFKYILDAESSTDRKLIELLKEHGISIRSNTNTNSTESKIDFAKKGQGIAHVIKVAAKNELQSQEVYEVDIPLDLPKSPLVLMYLNKNLRKIDKDFMRKHLLVSI